MRLLFLVVTSVRHGAKQRESGKKRPEDSEYGEYQYGYGIEDYSSVIRVLSFHKAEVEVMRESYERLGFYAALEIEELLEASGALFCVARGHGTPT